MELVVFVSSHRREFADVRDRLHGRGVLDGFYFVVFEKEGEIGKLKQRIRTVLFGSHLYLLLLGNSYAGESRVGALSWTEWEYSWARLKRRFWLDPELAIFLVNETPEDAEQRNFVSKVRSSGLLSRNWNGKFPLPDLEDVLLRWRRVRRSNEHRQERSGLVLACLGLLGAAAAPLLDYKFGLERVIVVEALLTWVALVGLFFRYRARIDAKLLERGLVGGKFDE